MRIRLILPIVAAALSAGCTLPAHITQVMPDEQLCSVHKFPSMYLYANDEHTREVLDNERTRRDLEPCPAEQG